MLIIRWKMVCEILFYTIIKSTCFKKKYSRRHSYIIFIYHINPFNCYLKMRQPKYITELAKNTNIDKKKKKGYALCHKSDNRWNRERFQWTAVQPHPNSEMHQETCGGWRHRCPSLYCLLYFCICNVPVKETGWGVMKEGKEKEREGKGGTERGREGRRLPTPFRGSLQSKFTWFLYTSWLLSNLSSSHFNLFTSHCQERRGKKLRILPWWVGNLSNKTEPSLSLCERRLL